MTFLMLIVLSISIAITAMRFGSAALQDNFVAEISTNYENSIEFVAFYGLLNFYMYTMAFVYSPSKNAQYGKLKNSNSLDKKFSLYLIYAWSGEWFCSFDMEFWTLGWNRQIEKELQYMYI